jgi:hypothetical protein
MAAVVTDINDNPALFVQEFEIDIGDLVAEKTITRPTDYTGMSLTEIRVALAKKAYTPLSRAFLDMLFCVYYRILGPAGLVHLERIVMNNEESFFMYFSYMLSDICNLAPLSTLPHKREKKIVRLDIEPNLVRVNKSVSLTASGSNLRVHLLAPTRKDRLHLETHQVRTQRSAAVACTQIPINSTPPPAPLLPKSKKRDRE